MEVGARDAEVDEPLGSLWSDPVLQFEFEAYPEAKLLSGFNLNNLVAKYGSSKAAAKIIGASEAFVRQKKAKP